MSFRQLPQLHIRVPSHVSSLSFSSQAQSEAQEQLVSNTTIIRLLDRTVEVANEVAQVSLSPKMGVLGQQQSCDSPARSLPASAPLGPSIWGASSIAWMLLSARCAGQQASGHDHQGRVPLHDAQDAEASCHPRCRAPS